MVKVYVEIQWPKQGQLVFQQKGVLIHPLKIIKGLICLYHYSGFWMDDCSPSASRYHVLRNVHVYLLSTKPVLYLVPADNLPMDSRTSILFLSVRVGPPSLGCKVNSQDANPSKTRARKWLRLLLWQWTIIGFDDLTIFDKDDSLVCKLFIHWTVPRWISPWKSMRNTSHSVRDYCQQLRVATSCN